ncbi:MAG: SWIM zinc finger family protein [Haloferacaceae archaeon]
MTHTRNTAASAATDAPDGPENGRAERARTEPMTVRPLRDGRYVVETEGGTYVVDLEDRTCTCPDHAIRGARCKHLRRVALDVTADRLPAPDERASACAVCGRRLFVPIHADGPRLCDRHDHAPGDVVRDRETGGLLLVVETTDERADEHRTEEDRLVAEYPTNEDYGDHEPVVLAVYLASTGDDPRRYAFPASRLTAVDADVAARLAVPLADDAP